MSRLLPPRPLLQRLLLYIIAAALPLAVPARAQTLRAASTDSLGKSIEDARDTITALPHPAVNTEETTSDAEETTPNTEETTATVPRTASRWNASIALMSARVLALDQYVKKWLQDKQCYSLSLSLTHTALPCDSDAYAADYGYPAIGLGARYAFNHGVTMRRYAAPDWGQLVPVDFASRLGNTFSLYLTFRRPILRSAHFDVGYTLDGGVGYSRSKYNLQTAPDNEFIGSRFLIYFGASAYATWYFADDWGARLSLEFYHHSNGALNRPNKGSNAVGPSLALVYSPARSTIVRESTPRYNPAFKPRFYLNFTLGVGAKTLLEDWQKTQYETAPEADDYRTSHFRLYAAYSLQADVMYRYARRWASGLGLDVFYGTYADHVRRLDETAGRTARHDPWSIGLAAKHQAYYHNLSVAMSIGVYLYRHMGYQALEIETPYYERIGLHYTIPALRGLELGINVKAHKTKADLTEFVVAFPLAL